MAKTNRHRRPGLLKRAAVVAVGVTAVWGAKQAKKRFGPHVRTAAVKAAGRLPVKVVKTDHDQLFDLATEVSFEAGGPYPEAVREAIAAAVALTVHRLTGVDLTASDLDDVQTDVKDEMERAAGHFRKEVVEKATKAVGNWGGTYDENPESTFGRVLSAVESMVEGLTGQPWSWEEDQA